MRTIYNQGQEVYDEVFFPNRKLTISRVNYDKETIEVCGEFYDFEGYKIDDETNKRISKIATLSTKSYSLNGFEQKSKVPTYKVAEKWYIDKYCKKVDLVEELDAVKKLSVLRDYYNNGWVPDLENYFYIGSFFRGEFVVREHKTITYDRRFLFFKTEELATSFLNEQKELLELAQEFI